jgi:hypothetical protein
VGALGVVREIQQLPERDLPFGQVRPGANHQGEQCQAAGFNQKRAHAGAYGQSAPAPAGKMGWQVASYIFRYSRRKQRSAAAAAPPADQEWVQKNAGQRLYMPVAVKQGSYYLFERNRVDGLYQVRPDG